jgi:hypothetical protein
VRTAPQIGTSLWCLVTYVRNKRRPETVGSSALPQTPCASTELAVPSARDDADENPGQEPDDPLRYAMTPMVHPRSIDLAATPALRRGDVKTYIKRQSLLSQAKSRVAGSIVVLLFLMHDKISEVREAAVGAAPTGVGLAWRHFSGVWQCGECGGQRRLSPLPNSHMHPLDAPPPRLPVTHTHRHRCIQNC